MFLVDLQDVNSQFHQIITKTLPSKFYYCIYRVFS